jgi:hypothetical protein
MTKEGKIKAAIMKYLRARGHFLWVHSNVGIVKKNGQRIPVGMKGVADIIGVRRGGQIIAVEVKAGYNKASEAQEVFLNHIRDMGGVGIVAYSIQDCVEAGL